MITDWIAVGHWLPERPHKPIGLLGAILAWHGTELICAGGHGLLHVPELPTSWFATQRWLYLDTSWNSLFLRAV